MRKPSIPVGLNPDEALTYMHEHHFKNRHPGIGDHFGLLMTYYDLVNKQDMEKNNGKERRAKASTDEIHQDRGAAEDPSAAEDDSGRHGKQRLASGVRDPLSVSDDARGTSSGSQDSKANGGESRRQRDPNGNGAGRTRVGHERPDPDAPLKEKLDYWRPRVMWREEE